MKLFLDTANLDEIREGATWGVVDGVTTNPTLLAREGGNWRAVVNEICELVPGPISVEVTSTDAQGMIEEAMKLKDIAQNVVIKIPMGEEGIKATSMLSEEGVKVNLTLVFSANQALYAAKAGAFFVSPFIGRLDDAGQDGMLLIQEMIDIFDNYNFDTQVLAASIRHPIHVVRCAQAGADIATIPYKVMKAMFRHPLTEKGLAAFLADWEKVKGE
jgi:transaldolase